MSNVSVKIIGAPITPEECIQNLIKARNDMAFQPVTARNAEILQDYKNKIKEMRSKCSSPVSIKTIKMKFAFKI